MSKQPKITPRVRALFALSKLSPALESAVLTDGSVAGRWKIALTSAMTVGNGISVNRAELFSAFRAVIDGKEVPPLSDEKGAPLDAKVSLDAEGAVTVELQTQRLIFHHAVLLSDDPGKRGAALDAIFRTMTLSREEQNRLRAIASKPDYADEDFAQIAKALGSAPEEFFERLQGKANVRQVSRTDVLPDDVLQWSNLVAVRQRSMTLSQFIDDELRQERQARISATGALALWSISLTFAAPSLVPHSMLDALDDDAMFTALDTLSSFDDHFALVGSFEICARRAPRDQRFVTLGERLLDRLFSDTEKLQTACSIFGASFVLALSATADGEQVKNEPSYWRRLAAAAQASLVVRAVGVTEIDREKLFGWAISMSGETYFLSTYSDFRTDPQWRPEWIENRFLVADAIGRAWAAIEGMPHDHEPATWRTKIEAAKAWAVTNKFEMLFSFPAVMEGARRSPISIEALIGPIQEAYRRLEREPSLENLLVLTPAIHAFGFPVEAREGLQKIIGLLRRSPNEDKRLVSSVLTLLSHVAALASDVKLADGVAEICIDSIASAGDRHEVVESIFRIIECSAADENYATAHETLLKRLEQAAYIVPAGPLVSDVLGLLEVLKTVNEPLRERLGRALALANLGVSRFSAA